MIAALLPASECLAVSDSDLTAASPGLSAAAGKDAPAASAATDAAPRPAIPPPRNFIPPPRKFSEQDIKNRLNQQSQSPIPPPARQPREATAPEPTSPPALETKPLEPVQPVLSTVALPGPDSQVNQPPTKLEPQNQVLATSERPSEPQAALPQTAVDQTADAPAQHESVSQALKTLERTSEPQASQPSNAADQPAAVPVQDESPIQALKTQEPPAEPQATQPQPAGDQPAAAPAKPESLSQALKTLEPPTEPEANQPQPAVDQAAAAPIAAAPSRATEPEPAPTQAQGPPVQQETAKSADKSQDGTVEKTSCATCGGFHHQLDGQGFSGSGGCANGNCIPGRGPCYPPANECNTVVGAFMTDLYQCLCCPDPCYEPRWEPAAYASFFADYARPRTVTRLRYDNLEDMTRPDRNQFWINNVKLNRPNSAATGTVGLLRARLQQVSLYQEAAGERGSFFVEYPYRQINESWAPTQAGFGDVNFGIKSLLFDCELLQIAFQLRTYMPSGNFTNNLGTGQFSLDPSILTSLKLGPETYFQGQFGNWVPLGGPGGNSKIAGGVFYWLMSLNQVLWYATPDSPLIATLEMDGWSFENGGYTPALMKNGTSPNAGFNPRPDGGGVSYFNIGPGLRQSICNRVDFGGALTWATNNVHWAQPWFRFEVRFLF